MTLYSTAVMDLAKPVKGKKVEVTPPTSDDDVPKKTQRKRKTVANEPVAEVAPPAPKKSKKKVEPEPEPEVVEEPVTPTPVVDEAKLAKKEAQKAKAAENRRIKKEAEAQAIILKENQRLALEAEIQKKEAEKQAKKAERAAKRKASKEMDNAVEVEVAKIKRKVEKAVVPKTVSEPSNIRVREKPTMYEQIHGRK